MAIPATPNAAVGPRSMLNMRNDYLMLEGLQSVTYTGRNGIVPFSQSVDHCVRYEVTDREVASSGGFLQMGDVVWEMPVSLLLFIPQTGDQISQDGDPTAETSGEAWSILEVSKQAFDTIWRLVCRKERS